MDRTLGGRPVPNCCYAEEYARYFTPRSARRRARAFLRRGLRGTGRELTDAVTAAGVDGAMVLEVGGGVGELHVDLLGRGASRAINVELSPGWEQAALTLLDRLDLRARVDRRIGDVVDLAEELPEADVVLLHRVVCCYPDWAAMMETAVAHARRVVGVTLPVDRWSNRVAIATGNACQRLRRRSFRGFVHPEERVLATARETGFRPTYDRAGRIWRTTVLVRPATDAAA